MPRDDFGGGQFVERFDGAMPSTQGAIQPSWLCRVLIFLVLQGSHEDATIPQGESHAEKQISSDKISKPNGHFSQATVIEAKGRIVFISGMTSRRPDGTIAGIGDIEAQTHQVCQNVKAAVEAAGRHDGRHLSRRRLCAQHGALREDPQSAAANISSRRRRPRPWWRSPR
jgi:enamine deaminase RidA (YjgF/YER057c/UK114 family)